MKVLVYPHDLAIGGSQINAIDLAAKVRDFGHEVLVYGVEGPLTAYIAEKGLRFVAADASQVRPAPSRVVQLMRLCRRERVDLIHGYEWPPCLDAYYGTCAVSPVVQLCTVLSMTVSPLVPDTVPLLMGTEELAAAARAARRPGGAWVDVFEPPIDTDLDVPQDAADGRRQYGLSRDEIAIVTVSRLSIDLKLDALVDAIDAAAVLAPDWPIRLIMVGQGDAEVQLRERAAEVNAALGREVVTLPGPTLDPRPAYAAADIVVGMGSSALRAMAHERPVVVQGEGGWSLPCEPSTLPTFLWQGFYGQGSGGSGGDALADHLRPLVASADRRRAVGEWSRTVVTSRFSLSSGAARLEGMYDRLVSEPLRSPLTTTVRTAGTVDGAGVRQRVEAAPSTPAAFT